MGQLALKQRYLAMMHQQARHGTLAPDVKAQLAQAAIVRFYKLSFTGNKVDVAYDALATVSDHTEIRDVLAQFRALTFRSWPNDDRGDIGRPIYLAIFDLRQRLLLSLKIYGDGYLYAKFAGSESELFQGKSYTARFDKDFWREITGLYEKYCPREAEFRRNNPF